MESRMRSHESARRKRSMPCRRLAVETLEDRCLLASSLNSGVLAIMGDRRSNVIDASLNSGTGRIEVLIDGANTDPANPTGYLLSDVQRIVIQGLKGNDKIRVGDTINLPSI